MKRLLWTLLRLIDDNWGYSTPIQQRFKVGERVKISEHSALVTNEPVTIMEFGRHDYLIKDSIEVMHIVYQFELKRI